MNRVKTLLDKDELRIRENSINKIRSPMNTNNYFFTEIEGIRFNTSSTRNSAHAQALSDQMATLDQKLS